MKATTLQALEAEIARARSLHPAPNMNALMEEVGEVSSALQDLDALEPDAHEERAAMVAHIRDELLQVATVAIRMRDELYPFVLCVLAAAEDLHRKTQPRRPTTPKTRRDRHVQDQTSR